MDARGRWVNARLRWMCNSTLMATKWSRLLFSLTLLPFVFLTGNVQGQFRLVAPANGRPPVRFADASRAVGNATNDSTQPAGRLFQVETTNFVVRAADSNLAKQVAHEAEKYRASLAKEWLGHELPIWNEKCPIKVEIAPHGGGETSFVFVGEPGAGVPTQWSMRIFGPPDRLLDAVLPHEITHTIFATHFGRPLPRWADEGACTTVEHESERKKIQELLIEFLTPGPNKPTKGIPFNRLFVMMNYPQNPDGMLPLYAQSYSLARFLILQKGRAHFVQYVGAALAQLQYEEDTGAWDRVTQQYYGFKDLSDLQLTWKRWVELGSNDSDIAKLARSSQPSANAVDAMSGLVDRTNSRVIASVEPIPQTFASTRAAETASSWYEDQMNAGVKSTQNLRQANSVSKSATNRTDLLISGEVATPMFEETLSPLKRANVPGERTVWR